MLQTAGKYVRGPLHIGRGARIEAADHQIGDALLLG